MGGDGVHLVGPTVAAYSLNLWASRKVEASLVSTFVYVQPVMTALMAVPLLDAASLR